MVGDRSSTCPSCAGLGGWSWPTDHHKETYLRVHAPAEDGRFRPQRGKVWQVFEEYREALKGSTETGSR